MVAQGVADQFGSNVNDLNHAVVCHAGWPDDTERANHQTIDFIRGADDRQVFERHHLAFTADEYANPLGLTGAIKQAQQLGLLLKQIKSTPQMAHVVREITDGQQISFAGNNDFVLCFGQDIGIGSNRSVHQAGNLGPQ